MPKTTVAIVHYHLRLGGVTRVIEQTISALADSDIDVVVVSGEDAPDFSYQDRLFVFPELSYDSHFNGSVELEKSIQKKVQKAGFAPVEIWHIHNHSLGKNAATPYFVNRLATLGRKLVLQPHDFAEDGRSHNYKLMVGNRHILPHLYPTGSTIKYAFLNSRDRAVFSKSGLDSSQSYELPNPVSGKYSDSKKNSDGNLILYPSRAIRRKNIGEIVLLAALDSKHDYAITLEPKNPKEFSFYSFWVDFCETHQIPVLFNYSATSGKSFQENIASAKALITTSVKEGFGMAFLEPWMGNKPVFGRNLVDITKDFTEEGVILEHLYSELPIPTEVFEVDELRNVLREFISQRYSNYGLEIENESEQWISTIIESGSIDFGLLNEELQAQVISSVLKDDNLKTSLSSFVPNYDSVSEENVAQNRNVISSSFSKEKYRDRLLSIYHSFSEDTPSLNYLNANTVLKKFLSFSSKSMLSS